MCEIFHPAVLDTLSDWRAGSVSRREFLRLATLLGVSVGTAYTMVGCGKEEEQTTDSRPQSGGIRRGGTMKIGSAVQRIDHPARLSWMAGANQLRQVAEYLTETGSDNLTRPWLLERWEADEAVKTWTLHLRKGVRFNNGDLFTSEDVLFNIRQWLNPDVGSSMLGLMSYLSPNNVEKVDDFTVRLHLDAPQIAVPEHFFHYPALVMHRGFEGDFIKQPVGTGPFELEEYTETERVILRRRDGYWRTGEDGQALPYLDGLIYLDLEPDARVAAMQSGQIDTLSEPRPADWQALKDVPGLVVQSARTAQTFVVRMRVDVSPWNDVRVRNALKLCLDREKILRLASFGQGDEAIDAHVAPVHPAYCQRPIPQYDPEKARALLSEAGHKNGLKVRLTTKNDLAEPEMAQALKEMALSGGFDIQLDIVEPSNFWDRWTEVDFGITAWTRRPLGTMVLALGYTADEQGKPVPWNETRWADEAFSKLLRQAERTLDVAARREVMCKIEDVMQERGPVGIPFWRKVWTIVRAEFQNVRAHPTSYDLFYDVWKRSV